VNALQPRESRRRRLWRRGLVAAGALLVGGGYALLSVPAEAIHTVAVQRAFAGLALVFAGVLVAAASRLWR
jgi:hypothetical protein